MADKDGKYTDTDSAERPPGPIEHVDVDVTVTPGENGSPGHAKKVERQLQSDVEQAIESAREGGAEKQMEAATDAVERAMDQADPSHVADVEVVVTGEVDGEEFFDVLTGAEIEWDDPDADPSDDSDDDQD